MAATAPEYEIRVLTMPRSVSRTEVRQLLTAPAEYGRWELARVRVYVGGERKLWLRRRTMQVHSTLDPALSMWLQEDD